MKQKITFIPHIGTTNNLSINMRIVRHQLMIFSQILHPLSKNRFHFLSKEETSCYSYFCLIFVTWKFH